MVVVATAPRRRETIVIERIPAEPPIGGPLWSVAIPAILVGFTFVATWLLYRHFTRKGT